MQTYYFKVKDNKITGSVSYPTDEFTETLTNDGYIEVDEEQYNEYTKLVWCKYVDGKVVADTDKIKQLENAKMVEDEYNDLSQKLASTDYVVIKIAEGVATEKEYADVLKNREDWRKRINELQKEI